MHKKSKTDDVEANVVQVLNLFGVEIQRYHGGSFARMDVEKPIVDASFVQLYLPSSANFGHCLFFCGVVLHILIQWFGQVQHKSYGQSLETHLR